MLFVNVYCILVCGIRATKFALFLFYLCLCLLSAFKIYDSAIYAVLHSITCDTSTYRHIDLILYFGNFKCYKKNNNKEKTYTDTMIHIITKANPCMNELLCISQAYFNVKYL